MRHTTTFNLAEDAQGAFGAASVSQHGVTPHRYHSVKTEYQDIRDMGRKAAEADNQSVKLATNTGRPAKLKEPPFMEGSKMWQEWQQGYKEHVWH